MFLIFFLVSRSSLTSNSQDVEAQKSTHRLIQEEDDLDVEQQNAESRCQNRDLDTKTET